MLKGIGETSIKQMSKKLNNNNFEDALGFDNQLYESEKKTLLTNYEG